MATETGSRCDPWVDAAPASTTAASTNSCPVPILLLEEYRSCCGMFLVQL